MSFITTIHDPVLRDVLKFVLSHRDLNVNQARRYRDALQRADRALSTVADADAASTVSVPVSVPAPTERRVRRAG